MSKKNKETLHIYTRVSTKGQSEKGMSLGEQRSRGIEVSKQLEMDYKVWNEGGKSSYTDDLINRNVLQRMIEGWKDQPSELSQRTTRSSSLGCSWVS